jgi:hypothetical protein
MNTLTILLAAIGVVSMLGVVWVLFLPKTVWLATSGLLSTDEWVVEGELMPVNVGHATAIGLSRLVRRIKVGIRRDGRTYVTVLRLPVHVGDELSFDLERKLAHSRRRGALALVEEA